MRMHACISVALAAACRQPSAGPQGPPRLPCRHACDPSYMSGLRFCALCVKYPNAPYVQYPRAVTAQDLAVLVNDQGMMLDDIESNITRAADRTAEAGGQLRAAERSQRGARNKMCFILLAVSVVLGVILLVSFLPH